MCRPKATIAAIVDEGRLVQPNEIAQVQRNLLASTRALLASHPAPAVSTGVRLWPQAERLQPTQPSSLPVLRSLADVCADAPPFAFELCANLRRAAPFLAWRRTYQPAEVGQRFLDNYGWTEIVGPNGLLGSAQIACGFLLLGRDTLYPPHRHEAEELYLPLAGGACWQKGAGPWVNRPPGSVIEHAGGESHAMRTGEHPLLAFYCWYGPIFEPARLEPEATPT